MNMAGNVRTYFQFASQSRCMKNMITRSAFMHETAIITAQVASSDLVCISRNVMNETNVSPISAPHTIRYCFVVPPAW